jgi:maleamate amidohydrolase
MEAEVYRAQGFGQRLSAGRRAALLVVDFVEGFVDPGVFGGGNISEAAACTVPVLAAFRGAGAPVIFTRIVYAADGSDAGLWCEKVPGLRRLTDDAPESRVIGPLAPRPGEPVVRKTQASAFLGTGLDALLIARSVDTLVVAGCTTSGCVRASVMDAIGRNFRPLVLTDCVGDRAIGPHEANLFDMGQKYADLIAAEDVAAVLAATG